ncbi:MAG: hypothetical protein KAR35_06215 [Candidatus Heimdallarchaeota archaeon]|nr:hypothetical protein [Candidatus Heimdallarchaeota archaeon]MCK5048953.1 hypothetical protein [Candidatus Heimdallarchaeota archaeon]
MSEPTKTKEAVLNYEFSFRSLYQWIPENHFFISLSLAIVFLLSGIRVIIAMTSGALYNELSLIVLVLLSTPIFLGPLIYALTQKYHLTVIPATLWGIVIGKLGQQLIAEPYAKLFLTMILLIAASIWITWLIPLSIKIIGSKEVILAIILGLILDLGLRAPTLGTDTGLSDHLFVLVTVFFALLLFIWSGIDTSQKEFLEEPLKSSSIGFLHGFVFTQFLTLYLLFYANIGDLVLSFEILAITAEFLLLCSYIVGFAAIRYLFHTTTFTKNTAYLYSAGAFLFVLISLIIRPWDAVWKYPLPFLAIMGLLLLLRINLDIKDMNTLKFGYGIALGFFCSLLFILVQLLYELNLLNWVYAASYGCLSLLIILQFGGNDQ